MAGTVFWPLPAVVDPATRTGICVNVPDDPGHLAAFMGALYGLTRWYNWDRDDAHTGKDVAAVWYDVFTHLGDCAGGAGSVDDMQFRQNGCKLEYSIDCTHWLVLYDPTTCIKDMIKGGEVGTGPLAPGHCNEYDVTLRGNDKWLLPVPVSSNYVITITEVSGAWNDGGSGGWNCPDGTPYVLGLCFGSAGHASGDPSSAAYHMELIGILGGATAVQFVSGEYTVPDPTDPTTFELQANDSDITNNFGAISFHVKVCEGPSENFSHTWDFSSNDQGWTAFVYGGQALAVYGSGGWGDNYPTARYDGIYIVSPLGNRSYTPVSITVTMSEDLNDNAIIGIADAGDNTYYLNTSVGAGNPVVKDLTGITTLPSQICLVIDNDPGGTTHSTSKIVSITIEGTGPDPF